MPTTLTFRAENPALIEVLLAGAPVVFSRSGSDPTLFSVVITDDMAASLGVSFEARIRVVGAAGDSAVLSVFLIDGELSGPASGGSTGGDQITVTDIGGDFIYP